VKPGAPTRGEEEGPLVKNNHTQNKKYRTQKTTTRIANQKSTRRTTDLKELKKKEKKKELRRL
jgi:hypothetical protein